MAHDVFISYSHADKLEADAVCNLLESKGVRCWMAPRDVLPGTNWTASIVDAVGTSRILVLVFSSNANKSPHIKREVERAIDKDLIVIPFRLEDEQPNKELGYFIGGTHWLDALTPPLEEHIHQLAETIRRFLAEPGSQKEPLPEAYEELPLEFQATDVGEKDSILVKIKKFVITMFVRIGILRWLARIGFMEAQYLFGEALYYGLGVSQDLMQAIYWYGQAANQGYPEAQFQLGVLSEKEFNNAEVAQNWYRIAADRRHKGARAKLE